jgi:hypothetical protein
MTPPLSPERLTRLLDDAVRPVTARPGALDRIRHGVRRRRTARRAGVVVLAAALVAGGTATALVMTPGGGPARITAFGPSAPVSSAAAKAAPPIGRTRTAALPAAAPSGAVPSPAPSGAVPSPAPSGAVPSAARSARPSFAGSAPSSSPPSSSASSSSAPSASSAPPSAVRSVSAPAVRSASPSANQPAATGIPPAVSSGAWAVDGLARPAARVAIVAVGNPRTTVSFLLVVHTARYGTQTVPFSATSGADMPPFGPVIVGAADAAKDGHTELFVLVDAGCCTEFWTIFRLVNGHIAQVSLDGAPVRLAVGGSVTYNAGFSCDGPHLVTYTYAYETASGTRMKFLATRDTYRWAGASLLLVSQRQVTIRGERNPELAEYSGVSCGGLPQYEIRR